MMDPVVTARVPAGVRARGVEVLHEIGSTTSELVNAAFEYVIQERKLPRPKAEQQPSATTRTLDSAERQQLAAFMNDVKVPVPEQWENRQFEDLLDQALEERYAGFC